MIKLDPVSEYVRNYPSLCLLVSAHILLIWSTYVQEVGIKIAQIQPRYLNLIEHTLIETWEMQSSFSYTNQGIG